MGDHEQRHAPGHGGLSVFIYFVNSLVVEKIDGGNKFRLGGRAESRVLFCDDFF